MAMQGEEEEVFMLLNHLPGMRFQPTDIELVGYYLRRRRILSSSSVAAPTYLIQELDVYDTEPWNLPSDAFRYPSEEKEMFFFTPRHRTSTSSQRVKRTAGRGYWRGNGERPIWYGPKVIGYKTQLTFTLLKGKEESKTDPWIMHEYCLHSASNTREFEDMVLCRIYKKKNKRSDGDTAAAAAAAGTSSAVVLWEEPEEGMLLNLQEAYIESSASFLPDMSAFDRSWEELGGLVPVADDVAVSVVVAGEQEAPAETDDRLLKRRRVEEPEQQQPCLMADNTESTMRSFPPPDAEFHPSSPSIAVGEQEAAETEETLLKRRRVEGPEQQRRQQGLMADNTESTMRSFPPPDAKFHTTSSSLAFGEQEAAETEETLLKRRRFEEPEQQQQQGLMADNNTESIRQPTSFDDDFLVEDLLRVDNLGISLLPPLSDQFCVDDMGIFPSIDDYYAVDSLASSKELEEYFSGQFK